MLPIRLVLTAMVSASLAVFAACAPSSAERAAPFPDVAFDLPDERGATRTAVFAGGCFWGTEAVFEHVKGVQDVVSGFAGGTQATADYSSVSSGTTQHAEAVRIVYEPTQVSYGQLLKIFFSVAHDPTQLNRQGPDVGPQYRSAIFVADANEQKVVEAYIEQLTKAKWYRKPIVTEVAPLQTFHVAEAYHQDYAARNPKQPYIVVNDAPKIAKLQRDLPQFYRDR
jgi:peptide-methionine (S)-S-oxide reductase